MKKYLILFFIVIIAIVVVIYNVGLEIGNVSIGKKFDQIERNSSAEIQKSSFAKNYLNSDSLVIVNLWASWCKPCIEEFPIFDKLEKENPDVKFVMMSIDRNEKDLLNGIDKYKIKRDITMENSTYRKSIRNFLENRSLDSFIKNEIVPITYIIKNGKVVDKEDGTINYSDFSQKIKNLK